MINDEGRPFLDDLWRRSAGLSEKYDPSVKHIEDMNVLWETQWSKEFDLRAHNRMVVGRYRYDDIHKQTHYDYVGYALTKLKMYNETGNLEYLLDARNCCMIEYIVRNHPNAHWGPEDDIIHNEKIIE